MLKPRHFYTLLFYLLVPFLPLRLLWRARKQPAYLRHWGERFGWYTHPQRKPLIWIHAVSVGETRASAPLIAALQTRFPEHHILLTHMTPTGRETGAQLFGDRVQQAYLPYDLPPAINNFITHNQPVIGLIMETELWPNLIQACHRQRIPLALINARLSEKSARGYARFPNLTREALQSLALICAQSETDAARLQQLGARDIQLTGNLKFDVVPPSDNAHLCDLWQSPRPIVLAASTRDGEEAALLDALPANAPYVLLIVPRHPQRFAEVADLLQQRRIPFQRRSDKAPLKPETRVLLGDSMGEMFAYYGTAQVAIIGGSLLPFGGQNLIEACALGVPVILGPHTHNFAQASVDAIQAGAALRVRDATEALQQAQTLLNEEARRHQILQAALQFALSHRGAVDKTLRQIAERLMA